MGAEKTMWMGAQSPTERELNRLLVKGGMEPHWWGNGPFDRYEAHEHSYHKVLYCLAGSITFTVHPDGPRITLGPGDRLDLPPFTSHSAAVGAQGCRCVEGWRFG